jgi:hypothetical protein
MIKNNLLLACLLFAAHILSAQYLFVPMDNSQTEHLKVYGAAFSALKQGIQVEWLLNYQGGTFLLKSENNSTIENYLKTRNIKFSKINKDKVLEIKQAIDADANMAIANLTKIPKIAVYSPKNKQPWDDAVTLALSYAEIPYEIIYDSEIINGSLKKYDWLHLFHEDFTGQYGKFWASYNMQAWYMQQVESQEMMARNLGFQKVSQMKLAVAKKIKSFVGGGGYLFAMCSATDSYDIALAAEGLDICDYMFDGDPMEVGASKRLDFSKTFAFQNFHLEENAFEYEVSDIDVTNFRTVQEENDNFTLRNFSAKTQFIPAVLCQNHVQTINGFMGQTTAFRKDILKPNVLILAERKGSSEARYIHGNYEKGRWTFYGGHDPEDYRHMVGEQPTDLKLHPQSPGYRLILNNIFLASAAPPLEKPKAEISLSFFPNPTKDFVNLQTHNMKGSMKITISDVNGKVLKSYSVENTTDAAAHKIDLRAYPDGSYIIMIENETGVVEKEKVFKG